jgi:hypothetical protein
VSASAAKEAGVSLLKRSASSRIQAFRRTMTARANTATATASHVRSNMPSASSSLKTSRSFNSFKDVMVQRPPDKDFLVDVSNNVSGNSHAKTPHHLPLSLHNLNLNYLKNILGIRNINTFHVTYIFILFLFVSSQTQTSIIVSTDTDKIAN